MDTDTIIHYQILNLYKTPSDEVLEYREQFYDLRRENDESIVKWLKRVKICLRFLLFSNICWLFADW